MQTRALNLKSLLRAILYDQDGQDLVEYALFVAVVAFFAVARMEWFARELSGAYAHFAFWLTTDIG